MGSYLSRVVLGVGVALLLLASSRSAGAQPRPGASAHVGESTQATAKKLAAEAVIAFNAKDYERSIAFNLKAFSLVPHPRLLFNIAQAHRLAGCPARAVPFYERYLTLEPKGKEAGAAQAALVEIKRAAKPDAPRCSKASSADDATSAAPSAGPPGRLKLRSVPEGVGVMLDGVKIGVTPIEHDLAAGTHSIVLVEGGTLVGEQTVEISAGETAELTMPVERPDRDSSQRRPSPLAPVLLWVGGGLALAGSGVAFYYGQKGWPDDKYSYRGATPAGVVLAVAGTAAVGAGVWLWMRGRRELRSLRESAPLASVGPSGAYLGWQGRF